MIAVTLTWFELEMAAIVAVRRHVEALRQTRPDRYGAAGDADGWQLHLEGAFGELAFAKALGRYWDGSINTFHDGGDVGVVQVRTRSRSDYDLIVRDADRDGDYFVLVVGRSPSYTVVGYILGADAKQPKWSKDHGGHGAAFFVPQSELRQFPATVAVAA